MNALRFKAVSDSKRRLNKNDFTDKSTANGIIYNKLNDVIGEGILDSILPFICAANLSTQNGKINVNHVCGLKSKTTTTTARLPSPRPNNGAEGTSKSATETNTNRERHLRKKSNHSIGLLSE